MKLTDVRASMASMYFDGCEIETGVMIVEMFVDRYPCQPAQFTIDELIQYYPHILEHFQSDQNITGYVQLALDTLTQKGLLNKLKNTEYQLLEENILHNIIGIKTSIPNK